MTLHVPVHNIMVWPAVNNIHSEAQSVVVLGVCVHYVCVAMCVCVVSASVCHMH